MMVFRAINTPLMNLIQELAWDSTADGVEFDEFEHFQCAFQGGNVTCCLNT